MELGTYSNFTLQYGNLSIQGITGDVLISVPNDSMSVEVDSLGGMIAMANAQGLVRSIVFNITENSPEDLFFKAVMDAQNRQNSTNKNLVGLPLVAQKSVRLNNIAGISTTSFKNIVITKRERLNDAFASTNGEQKTTRIQYTLVGVIPFFVNEDVFYPI